MTPEISKRLEEFEELKQKIIKLEMEMKFRETLRRFGVVFYEKEE